MRSRSWATCSSGMSFLTAECEDPLTLPSKREIASQPRSYRVLKIAPTSFFADYGCHVRILEETLALQGLGSRVTICTYRSGRDLPDIDIRRSLGLPRHNAIQVGSSPYRLYFDAVLAAHSLLASVRVRPDIVHA